MDTATKLVLDLPEGASQEFTLSKATVTIGRSTTNDIALRDPKLSRSHAQVQRTTTGYSIVDLDSANGVRVNEVPVTTAVLAPGDVITMGDTTFRFALGPANLAPDVTGVGPDLAGDATLLDAPLAVRLEETSGPRVAIHTPGRTWEVPLLGERLTIGRNHENDIVVESTRVSRRHAVIERRGEGFFLRDLESQNGTFVGDTRVTATVIEDGQTIRIGPARLLFKRGFQPDDLTVVETPRSAGTPTRRPVVVVPGFAGSKLWRGNEQIWPVPRRLLANPDLLHIDEPLEARGVLDEVVIIPNLVKQDQYSLLVDYLTENLGYETGKDLLEFGYDFRQDNRLSAKRLGEAIDAWNVKAPITIIAHSMGCLVTRYYVECLGGRNKVERIVFMGGPHSGTPYSFVSLLTGPRFLPLGLMATRLRDILASYPSWYQILPMYAFASDERSQKLDVLTDETWVTEVRRPLLRDAQRFRKELGTRSSVPAVSIFGYGLKTVTTVTVARESGGLCRDATLNVTTNGDGTIPEVSAVLQGTEIHPVRQHHGSLYVDNDVRMRLKLELTRPGGPA